MKQDSFMAATKRCDKCGEKYMPAHQSAECPHQRLCDLEGFAYLPCQICGKPVLVKLPFVGCVFCAECPINDSSCVAESKSYSDGKTVR